MNPGDWSNHLLWPQIRAWLSSHSVEPPLLLIGNDTAGIHTWLERIEQAGFCESMAAGMPCSQCRSCNQVTEGKHASIISAQLDNDRIKIKEIRRIKSLLNLASWNGKRLVVIEQAEKLELEAANTLLKTLEEPVAETRFVLATIQWRLLLPTIRSRCAVMRLNGASSKKLSSEPQWLRLKPAERMAWFQNHELTEDDLEAIYARLATYIQEHGPTAAAKQAHSRWRDYYYITASGGNEKMARDLLVSSLPY